MSNAGGSANIGINLNTADLQAAIARIVAEANAAIQRVNANAPSISAGQLTVPNIPQGLDPAAQAAFVNALPGLLSRQISALGRQSGGLPSGANVQGFTGGAFGKSQIGDLLTSQLFGTTDLKAALGAVNSPLGQLSPQAIKGILNGPGLGSLSSGQIFNPTTLDARFSSLINSINTRLANFGTPGRQFIGDNDPNQLATDRVGAAQLEAAILEEIAKRKVLSDAYTEAVVSTKRQTAINEAAVQKQLSGDQAYLKAKTETAAALAVEEAAISKSLAGNTEYTNAKTLSAKSAAQEAAIIQNNLVQDSNYIKAKQISAVALAKEAALIQQGLAGSGAYLTAKTDLAIAQVQEQRNLANRLGGNQNLASSRQYVAEKTGLATAQARQEAAINQSLAGEQAYLSSKSALAASQARLAANINQAMVTDGAYLASKADLVISQEALSVALKAELLSSANQGTYIQLKASNATLLAQEKAALAQTLAGNTAYIQAKAEVAVAAKAESAAIARAIQNDPLLRASSVFSATDSSESNASRKREETAALLRSPTYARDTGQEAADRVRLTTQENIAKLQSIQGDQALAQAKRTELGLKDQILLEELRTFSQTDAARKAQITIERQRAANLTRIAELEFATSAQGQAALREKARSLILQRQYNQALQRELAAELRESGRPFAALTTRFGGGGFGGGASGGSGAAGFFGGGLMSTLKYSIPSALLFGAVAGIGSTIKEAEELNKTLSLLQAQLENTGQGGKFEGLREDILAISRETGIATNNVAKFAVQLEGAFGRNIEINGLSGQDLVKRQVEGVSRLDALLGLDDKQVIDTTVAVGRQFGVLAEEIGNVAFQAQQFGIPAEELQVFLADIAPVAKDAGFSLEEISAIGAAAILNSGKSASSIAEAWGRVIPAVTKAKTELLGVALSNEALNNEQFKTAVATGDVATIINEIGTNLDNLDNTSRDFIINLLGGRREAQAILAAFSDPQLLTDFNFDKGNADAQNAAYERLKETLGQNLKELSQILQQLGIAILDAGLADALKFIVVLFKQIAGLATGLLTIFGGINKALGGIPALILAAVGAMRLFNGASAATGGTIGGRIANSSIGQRVSNLNQPPGTVLPAASGAATAASIAGAALTVGLTYTTYQNTTASLKGQEEELRETIKEANDKELENIASQYNGFWDQVQEGVFKVDLPGSIAQAEILSRDIAENDEFFAGFAANDELAEQFSALIREKYREDAKAFLDSLSDKEKTDVFDSKAIQGTIPDFSGLDSIGVNTVFDTDTLRAIIEDAKAGDQASQQFILDFLESLPDNSEVRNLVQEIIDLDAGTSEAVASLEDKTANLKEAELGVRAGTATFETYEAALRDNIAAQRKAFEDSVAQGSPDYVFLEEAINGEEKLAGVIVERLKASGAAATRIAGLSGDSGDIAQAQLDNALAALNDPELTDTKSINDFVDQAIAAEQALFDAQIEQFDTAAEKLAFANSGAGELDTVVLQKIILAQLNINNEQWSLLLENYSDFFDTTVGVMVGSVLSAGALGKLTLDEVNSKLDEAIIALQFSGEGLAADQLLSIQKKIEQAKAFGASDEQAVANAIGVQVPEDTSVVNDQKLKKLREDAQKEAEQAAEEAKRQAEEQARAAEEARQAAIELQNAQFEYYKILAGGDSLAVANISIDQARFALANAATPAEWQQATNQLAQAERERKEAEDAIIDARFSYAEVLAGDSAIGAAKIAQQRAAKAMQDAEGVAEELEALAQQFSADRAFELAIRSIFDAQANVVAAMAGYLDDSVASANVGLALAERQYQEALKDYNAGLDEGGEKLLGAQANLINAQATARDAELQGKLDELSVQFEFEKISKNQYIQYLKALKQMPDITKKQVLEIDRQIKQLSGELQQDLQFNLPTNLDLPTLYEVRRSIGSSSSGSLATNGGGYNDNRNVNVVINVNNDADRALVTQVLEDNLGAPPRSGTAGRFY